MIFVAKSERDQSVTVSPDAVTTYKKTPFVLKTLRLHPILMASCSNDSCTISSAGKYIMSMPSVFFSFWYEG